MHGGRIQYIAIANASVRILGQASDRKRLTIYPPASGTITIANDPPAVAGNGITLSAGMAPLYFDADFHGACVSEEWYGIKGDSTVTTVGFIEATCDEWSHRDKSRT